jgi:16S rRNA (cytosine1402-N4)-methyltransferase
MAAPSFNDGVKRSVKAGAAETEANPRARSARLRVAIRTEAAAFAAETDLLPKRAPTLLGAPNMGAM